MQNKYSKSFIFSIAGMVLLAGCATTRAKKPNQTTELQNQVAQLQNEVQAKDQQIQELQTQVENRDRSSNFSSGSSGGSTMIRVSGVSVKDVQRALAKAGFDPGPIDGRAGKKTKLAVKHFQSKQGLPADGVVGKKTWSALNQ